MKKFLLSLSAVFITLTASATDVWIWTGGEYLKTKVDSITFAEPAYNSTDNVVKPKTSSLYNDYSGTLSLSVMGFSAGNASPVVTVDEVANGIAKVIFSDFSASGYSISGFVADNVTVTPNADGSYSLEQSNFTTTAQLNGESGELSKCTLSGSVSSDGEMTLNVSFTVSSFPVSGTFTGNR